MTTTQRALRQVRILAGGYRSWPSSEWPGEGIRKLLDGIAAICDIELGAATREPGAGDDEHSEVAEQVRRLAQVLRIARTTQTPITPEMIEEMIPALDGITSVVERLGRVVPAPEAHA